MVIVGGVEKLPAIYTAFVVMKGTKFCKFGSYHSCRLVESPLKANLYSRRRDAERRIEQGHVWVGEQKLPTGKSAGFRIVPITVQIVGGDL